MAGNVKYVLFNGPAELEGLGFVNRIDIERPVLVNSSLQVDPEDLELEVTVAGGLLTVKTVHGVDSFALASGKVMQWRTE